MGGVMCLCISSINGSDFFSSNFAKFCSVFIPPGGQRFISALFSAIA
jgi:hypothetical protein